MVGGRRFILHPRRHYLFVEEKDINSDSLVLNQPAGHVEVNEVVISAVKRELQEETGLTGISFQEIGKQRTKNTIFISYLVITECDKTSVKLQEGETIGYQWLKEEEFLRFLNSSEAIPSQRERLREFLNFDIVIG